MISFKLPLCLAAFGLSPVIVSAQAQVNWRQADSVRIGQNLTRIEVSSTRRMRVITTNNQGQSLTSADMSPEALKTWTASVQTELASPRGLGYEFENTLEVQPARKGADSVGYVITVADSLGNTHATFATASQTRALVVALSRAVYRLPLLQDEELAQTGALPSDSRRAECDRVQDSVFTRVHPDKWPIARASNREVFRFRAPFDAVVDVPITASMIVLPNGVLDSTSFRITGTADPHYEKTARDFLLKMKWIPARVGDCPVVSRASLLLTRRQP
jgi:hypothetical protein